MISIYIELVLKFEDDGNLDILMFINAATYIIHGLYMDYSP